MPRTGLLPGGDLAKAKQILASAGYTVSGGQLHYPSGKREEIAGRVNSRALLSAVGHMLFVLWVVTTLLFFMFRLMPGSPLAAYIDTSMTAEQQAILLHQFGLDRPLWQQYLFYLLNLAQGNLGVSFIYKEPGRNDPAGGTSEYAAADPDLAADRLCVRHLGRRLPGRAPGHDHRKRSRCRPSSPPGHCRNSGLAWCCLPSSVFSLGWLPAGGATSAGASFPSAFARYSSLDYLRHLVLPALTLAIFLQGLPTLLMRSNMLEVLQEEFVVMSRIKGLSEWSIIIRHAARNALLPVATALALGIGSSIGGNVVIESVFSWPGLGRRLVKPCPPATTLGTGCVPDDRHRPGGDELRGGRRLFALDPRVARR